MYWLTFQINTSDLLIVDCFNSNTSFWKEEHLLHPLFISRNRQIIKIIYVPIEVLLFIFCLFIKQTVYKLNSTTYYRNNSLSILKYITHKRQRLRLIPVSSPRCILTYTLLWLHNIGPRWKYGREMIYCLRSVMFYIKTWLSLVCMILYLQVVNYTTRSDFK